MTIESPALARLAFALWVSICAAAPEFIWQGLLQLGGHFTLVNLYSVIVIGLILAFFVEPILQRIRSRRWEVDEHGGHGVLPTVVLALAFGVAAVAVHECMNAYVGGNERLPAQRQEGLRRGVDLILQWALVPFVVTLAWFGARRGRLIGWFGAALACLWTIAVGRYYDVGLAWNRHDRAALRADHRVRRPVHRARLEPRYRPDAGIRDRSCRPRLRRLSGCSFRSA